jgi:glycosyltransferase involved in cell wall biosynthesis
MARISVIIPAYNAEPYIDDTIQSALAQTCADDIEIIVIDDGSTDQTVARLRTYGKRVIVDQQPNSGVAAARNRGARAATGEWLAFLDADDIWLPDKLERQLRVPSADFVYTDRYNIGARGELPEIQSRVTPMYEGDLFVPLLLEGNFITASSVLLRRSLFIEMGGFFEGLQGTEDWDLWVRIAAEHPIGLLREPLVRYRFHASGLSRNYRRMWGQRDGVVARALSLPRGRALPWAIRRRIRAQTWITNAWEAGQAGQRGEAIAAYVRAWGAWPLDRRPYREVAKLCDPRR